MKLVPGNPIGWESHKLPWDGMEQKCPNPARRTDIL